MLFSRLKGSCKLIDRSNEAWKMAEGAFRIGCKAMCETELTNIDMSTIAVELGAHGPANRTGSILG